jgi:hypothetical protein
LLTCTGELHGGHVRLSAESGTCEGSGHVSDCVSSRSTTINVATVEAGDKLTWRERRNGGKLRC